ncbi:hypothetical protein H8E88_18020 [candidate division KSB1 bacterium]|nr:hypothetical protein [candidate division KSB1 bacterium]
MITDNHQNTEKFLIENYRKKTFSEKMRMIKEITIACQKMALSGIKQRHPDADNKELRLRLGALWLTKETMLNVYHWDVEEKGL